MMEPLEAIIFHQKASDYHNMQETMWDAIGEPEVIPSVKYHEAERKRHDEALERLKLDWPKEYETALEQIQLEYEAEAE